MLKNLSVVQKFLLLVAVSAAGMLSLFAVSNFIINSSSIGGAAYGEIVDSKDLLADILPPPMNHLSVSATESMREASDAVERLALQVGVLRELIKRMERECTQS